MPDANPKKHEPFERPGGPASRERLRRARGNPGFSLVELLVVILISVIVTGVVFSVYRLNASFYLREDSYLQQYQNLRVALYTVARDARMAGNGMSLFGPTLELVQLYSPSLEVQHAGSPPTVMTPFSTPVPFRHSDAPSTPGARAIFGVDGGATSSDTLTIFRGEVETVNPLGLVREHTVGDSKVRSDEALPPESIKVGDIVAIGDATQCHLAEVGELPKDADGSLRTIVFKRGGRYARDSTPVIPGVDLTGSFIFNFRNAVLVTYWVDEENLRLMADWHDVSRDNHDDPDRASSIVAYNIEDLQVYYFFDTDAVDNNLLSADPDISSVILADKRVKAVTVGLVSRSPRGVGLARHGRPELFNRAAGPKTDNTPRSVLVETVYLRNYHN
jgi:prepilin-type N-terminal cleavage/methylation domain-containing protein